MRRRSAFHFFAILGLCAGLVFSQEADPCKRQPFRGRCPGTGAGGQQLRSQFVLRYYLRNGECVSYPYGHCANDENEPKLFRYKEECEDACLAHPPEEIETTTTGGSESVYATVTTSGEGVKTECQKQREQKGTSRIHGGFVPECTENGEFREMQCEPDGQVCFCVDRNGIEMPNSRTQSGQTKPNCEKIMQAPPMKTNECTGGLDKGPCSAAIKRWYYDEADYTCKEFEYSGCGGSGNNYPTKESCEHRCAPPSPAETQLCHRNTQPFKNPAGEIVDCAKTECPAGYKCNVGQQRSVCCKDDQKSGADELHSGVSPQLCTLPKERGPCDKYELRFYYNRDLKECKYFFYGGCDGNTNNFARIEDCQRVCITAPPKTTQGSTSATTIATERTVTTDAIRTTSTLPDAEETDSTTPAATGPTAAPTIDSRLETEPATTHEEMPATTDQTLIKFPSKRPEESPSTPQESTSTTEPIPRIRTQSWSTTEGGERTDASTTAAQDRDSTTGEQSTTAEQAQSETTQQGSESTQPADSTSNTPPPPSTDRQSPTTVEEERPSSTDRFAEETTQETPMQTRAPNTLPPPPPPAPQPDFRMETPRPRPQTPSTTRQTTPTTTTVPLPDNRCEHPKDKGNCAGKFDRWYWNDDKRICESFGYTGCGGNGNNFGSREECLSICHVQVATSATTPDLDNLNVCETPIEKGECGGAFQRFAYDAESNECRSFQYTGCGGNGNNFANVAECQRKCMRNEELPPVPEDCPPLDLNLCVEPCIIFSNRIGCQECVCPVQPPSRGSPTASPPRSEPNSQFNRDDLDLPRHEPHIPRRPAPPAPPSPPGSASPPSSSGPNKKPSLPPVHSVPINPIPNENEIPNPPRVDQFPGLGEKCTQHVDPGPCTNFVTRYHYNFVRGECEPFQYGGCAGNRNHFFTQNECQLHCGRFRAPTTPSETSHQPTPQPEQFFRPLQENAPAPAQQLPAEFPRFIPDNAVAPPSPPVRQPETASPQGRPSFSRPGQDQEWHPPPPSPTFEPRPREKFVEPVVDLPQNRPSPPNHQPIDFNGRPRGSPPTREFPRDPQMDNSVSARAEGIATHPNDKSGPVGPFKNLPEKPLDPSESSFEEGERIPVCPNGFKAMHYSNGGPIMCLPGKNQCPDKSVCYFNGIDFYCCPNENDPYDRHIFGGYDGEETKHGYKTEDRNSSRINTKTIANETPKVRKARQAAPTASQNFARRPLPPSSFSIDHVTNSLRFDGQAPQQYTQARLARVNPCVLPAERGSCEGGAIFRYFYDIKNDECRSFIYSGCDGTENNFLTKRDCEQRCKLGPILTAKPTTTTKRPVAAGHCPNGQAPLGDNAPVLCGNQTDSIGCPPGYYCRVGPPDVCCPEDLNIDLGKVLASPRGDVRRKPFVPSAADRFQDGHKGAVEFPAQLFPESDERTIDLSASNTSTQKPTTSTTPPKTTPKIQPELLVPANMCPDGSDSLPELVCGSGFDGHKLCPRGFYCSIDRERNSRLCCRLDIQEGSKIPPPPPVIAPYLGTRRTNPGEAIERGSLPSDSTPQKTFGFRRKL